MDIFKGKNQQRLTTEQNIQAMYNKNRPSEVNTDGTIAKGENTYTELNRVVNNDLTKGGAGSRGGKVIGYTKSGKAIYDKHDHDNHSKFDADDHAHAAVLHGKRADEANSMNDFMQHNKSAVHH